MKKTMIILVMLAIAISPMFANGSSEAKPVEEYTFGGSSTVAPVAEAAIEQYQKENAGVKLSYETLGSSVGIKQLQEGTLSLAGSSRELKSSELAAGLIPHTIALDALSVAINSSVGIANLTIQQLSAIFSGEITNWKEVGGKDASIVLIVRDESSGTYGSFKEIVLDSQKKTPSKNAIVARENGELAAKIASTTNSIGYIGMAFNHLVTEKGGTILSIDGVNPSEANVKNGTYPIRRELYVVTKGDFVAGSVQKSFFDFLLSKKGQAIVSEVGFVSL
ncbi:phosphate ABC transporter substrate-binding protein [uncultured Sphaerochaeta sp.]|uniref:phosphate ABC transporter substrate-binding protein n=1 Tax=uncultured Sphaerochaeta sp. TaxID=886478 RepID=UPI002A0A96C2|nr:phosphate ABC transporter substrate-binding protein [uncultured Sphaerochaeta sp.]